MKTREQRHKKKGPARRKRLRAEDLMRKILRGWSIAPETESQFALRQEVHDAARSMQNVAKGIDKLVAMLREHSDPRSRMIHLEQWALKVQEKLAESGIQIEKPLR